MSVPPAVAGTDDPQREHSFPRASRQQWRELVAAVLTRSATSFEDPELALTRTTLDGIDVRPLYTADDAPYPSAAAGVPGRAPFVRGASRHRGWEVRQRHGGADPDAVNAAIRTDLANGVTSVWLEIGSADHVAAALDGVALARTSVVLDAGAQTVEAARALLSAPGGSAWSGNVGADPIGWAHRRGTPADLSAAVAAMTLREDHPRLRAIVVDGTVYHDAGASDADELAIVTAAGVTYLRTLTDAGASITDALAAMEFRLAVTDDQFASMAKLRAARRIWHRVGELCRAPELARAQRQHAVTSAAMMTRRDPYPNIVRTTVAAFAAAAGGAQAITVAPFDQALGGSEPLARRIARNTQAVLHDEVSLARVADPGGGSWYVEARTDALARAAWDAFTALERRGGATELAAVSALIATSRGRRDRAIADGQFPITGVNRFVDPDEIPLSRRPGPIPPAGGLPRTRYAEADERGWPA